MHEGRLIFAQLMDFIPKRDFDDSVKRYRGDYRKRLAEHVGRKRRTQEAGDCGETVRRGASGGEAGREALPHWRREASLAVG
jgi:hypothetical protein